MKNILTEKRTSITLMLSTVIMARADKALAISISLREVNNE